MNKRPVDGIAAAIFTNSREVETAIGALRGFGFEDDDLGLIIADPSHYRFLDRADSELITGIATGAREGALIGAPVGSIAGLGLLLLLVPGIGTLAIGGGLAVGAALGALWGVYLGAETGIAARIQHITDVEQQYEIPLRRDELLLVVLANQDAANVCTNLQRHGGHCVAAHAVKAAPAATMRGAA